MSDKSASGRVFDVTHPTSALRRFAQGKQKEMARWLDIISRAKSSSEDPKTKK